MKNKKIGIILGTRPEIIKMSPIIKEFQRIKNNYFIIHTNQHYNKELDEIFFDELKLPRVKYNLGVGSGSHGEITGKMITGIEKILLKEKPFIVLVQGDTNTVLAGALAAKKIGIKVGHIEAGLRSFFREMPEEINRIVVDHISDYLFAPTKNSEKNLLKEGISRENIFVVGNTIVDAIKQSSISIDSKRDILKKLNLKKKDYFLLTLHRPENVDKKEILLIIFHWLSNIKKIIIFPIHPRTEKMINYFKIKIPQNIILIEPIGYLDLLFLQKNAKLVITDSGGLQEESCILKVPCVTLRHNTERPETVDIGSNVLIGNNQKDIEANINFMLNKKNNWSNPFGRFGVAKRILKIINEGR